MAVMHVLPKGSAPKLRCSGFLPTFYHRAIPDPSELSVTPRSRFAKAFTHASGKASHTKMSLKRSGAGDAETLPQKPTYAAPPKTPAREMGWGAQVRWCSPLKSLHTGLSREGQFMIGCV